MDFIIYTSRYLQCDSHLKAVFGTPQEYLQHCGASIPTGWAYIMSNITTDFITLIIPIPVVSSAKIGSVSLILTLKGRLPAALHNKEISCASDIHDPGTVRPHLKRAL
jgi:hypothetical protein